MIYLNLFITFFQIGLFSFGGGYAVLALINHHVVEVQHWLNAKEFADIVTLSQMTPGPIALNSATFVGQRMAGFLGSVTATIAVILPSLIIVLILGYIYTQHKNHPLIASVLKGLRPVVTALIASAGLGIVVYTVFNDSAIPWDFSQLDLAITIMILIGIIVQRKTKWDSLIIISLSGVIGLVLSLASLWH